MSDRVPSYRLHKQSGQAIVTLPDGAGGRRDVLLGPYGSDASHERYARVLAEWKASIRRPPVDRKLGPALSVNEFIEAFWSHAEAYYRHADGTPTSEISDFRYSLKPLRKLYGLMAVGDFTPQCLKAVRQHMVEADWSRCVINQRIGRIRRMFRWGVSEGLVPVTVSQALGTVAGLSRGRSGAREMEPVKPVPEAFIDAVRPYASRHVWAMVELQRLTGMRPGEVVQMRARDLETSGAVWFYRPSRHKTEWRGKDRVVALGPRAQAIVKEFLTPDLAAFLFSPRRAMEERAIELRARRRTPVQPSQRNRRKPRREKQPGERYTRESYTRAIATAALRADQAARQAAEDAAAAADGRQPARVPLKLRAERQGERLVPHWCPLQLRHNHATEVRRRYGLEAAQVMLGHSRADVTQVYAERDLSLAERIAGECG
jgi:integrase